MELRDGEVHVWRVWVEGPHAEAAMRLASPAERDRAASFRQEADRRRSLASHGALRDVLARYTGAPAGSLAFDRTCAHCGAAHGKPRLAGDAAAVRFNLSHSGGLAAVAVGRREVGIDVEEVKPGFDHAPIAAQFFSPPEQAALRSAPAALRDRLFFDLWTRKEAALKVSGYGLAVPLDQVEVLAMRPAGAWLSSLELGAGHAGTVAVEGGPAAVRAFDWAPN